LAGADRTQLYFCAERAERLELPARIEDQDPSGPVGQSGSSSSAAVIASTSRHHNIVRGATNK
jgi:hypothetical protein